MKKLIAALVLASIFVAQTTARVPIPTQPVNDSLFVQVEPKETPKTAIATPTLAPIVDTMPHATPHTKPLIRVPVEQAIEVAVKPPKIISNAGFKLDPEVSFYGPGFYGHRTACGKAYTKKILGVAHKSLPCGTLVTFMWEGKSVTVPVIDRGPYVAGRQWDLSGGLCTYLNHCFTGPIYYRIH